VENFLIFAETIDTRCRFDGSLEASIARAFN
jgi:hypothetical protein